MSIASSHCILNRGHREGGRLGSVKNFKTPISKDISNSFHEVTHIGLESHQFFSFQNISTNTVTRDGKSFGKNELWLAGWLSFGQKFNVKFAQTHDKQMLKISRRYLYSYLI